MKGQRSSISEISSLLERERESEKGRERMGRENRLPNVVTIDQLEKTLLNRSSQCVLNH